jgi:hypothetical protein
MKPWEVEVLFFSNGAKRIAKPKRVNVRDMITGWGWRPSPAEVAAARKNVRIFA